MVGAKPQMTIDGIAGSRFASLSCHEFCRGGVGGAFPKIRFRQGAATSGAATRKNGQAVRVSEPSHPYPVVLHSGTLLLN